MSESYRCPVLVFYFDYLQLKILTRFKSFLAGGAAWIGKGKIARLYDVPHDGSGRVDLGIRVATDFNRRTAGSVDSVTAVIVSL